MDNSDSNRTLSDEQYRRFVDLIFRKTGIWFEDVKKYFVEKRLLERMEILVIDSIRDYYYLLKFGSNDDEFQELLNRLTINETYFFRDYPQLAGFAEQVLPIIVPQKQAAGEKYLRIWSAGCSTGEEPYTLAIIFQEMLPAPEEWNVQIVATDINSRVLETARRGIYGSRSTKDVPLEYLERYFTTGMNFHSVNLSIKNMVDFRYLNLNDESSMKGYRDFDVIFCRNVLIYFNPESRLHTVGRFYRSLKSGGYIFLGHSESVSRITEAFTMRRIGDNIVYVKP
jgi:chemotaxis protein methyltransferase CheR